jgi:hypothetical protein
MSALSLRLPESIHLVCGVRKNFRIDDGRLCPMR